MRNAVILLAIVALAACAQPKPGPRAAAAPPVAKLAAEDRLDPDAAAALCPVPSPAYQGLTVPGVGCIGQPGLRPPGPIGVPNLP